MNAKGFVAIKNPLTHSRQRGNNDSNLTNLQRNEITNTKDSQMNKQIEVRDYMRSIQQETPDKPCLPGWLIESLRQELIVDEAKELREACTPAEALGEIADLLVVVYGSAVAYGFSAEQVDEAFRVKMQSNNAKLWTEREVAETDMEGRGLRAWLVPGGKYLVKDSNGKQIKPPSYVHPDYSRILEEN